MASVRRLTILVESNKARLRLKAMLSNAIGPSILSLEHLPSDRNLWVMCILDRTILADDIEAVGSRSQLEFVAVRIGRGGAAKTKCWGGDINALGVKVKTGVDSGSHCFVFDSSLFFLRLAWGGREFLLVDQGLFGSNSLLRIDRMLLRFLGRLTLAVALRALHIDTIDLVP